MAWTDAIGFFAVGWLAGQHRTASVQAEAEMKSVLHNMANGGCLDQFSAAVHECHPELIEERQDPNKRAVDGEACVKATAALRECFAGNPACFRNVYLRRIDKGLDQDLNKPPEMIKEEAGTMFRWWAGMRRT